MRRETLDRLRAARAASRPVALLTDLTSGDQDLYDPAVAPGAEPLAAELRATADQALRNDASATVATQVGGPIFVHVFNPPLRLIVIGAVHIAQVLVPMARLAGYAVTVIDPRRAFATDARFPEVEVSREWPHLALERLAPDPRTAVVTLSHDPKLDDRALPIALRSPAFYVGALGSRRTHGLRVERLREAGLDDTQIGRIWAPVGLDIGSKSPAEISISILAQMTEVLRRPKA